MSSGFNLLLVHPASHPEYRTESHGDAEAQSLGPSGTDLSDLGDSVANPLVHLASREAIAAQRWVKEHSKITWMLGHGYELCESCGRMTKPLKVGGCCWCGSGQIVAVPADPTFAS